MMKTAFAFLVAATVTASVASAQQPTPAPAASADITLTVTQQDVTAIGQAIMYLPKMVADPLLAKLQAQIDEQQRARAAAAPKGAAPKKD